MKLTLNILLLIVGFVALIKGADWFVDGSAGIAKRFRVPGIIIGLTIVAMGTSAPELAVSTTAALQGSNEIALSNVIGSNVFNLMVVLGICAIIHKVPVEEVVVKRDFSISIAAAIFLLITTCGGTMTRGEAFGRRMDVNIGLISRWVAIIMLVFFVMYIIYLIYDAKKNPTEEDEDSKSITTGKCILLILIGLVLIVGGGQAVVYSAKFIARSAGMTETLIGLTIVALGTSLPELVTSIVAARKGETGLAIGNVVGSNIFNILLILGVSSAIHPVVVNRASMWDMMILILFSILVMLFVIRDKALKRSEGIIMVLLYIADVVFAAFR